MNNQNPMEFSLGLRGRSATAPMPFFRARSATDSSVTVPSSTRPVHAATDAAARDDSVSAIYSSKERIGRSVDSSRVSLQQHMTVREWTFMLDLYEREQHNIDHRRTLLERIRQRARTLPLPVSATETRTRLWHCLACTDRLLDERTPTPQSFLQRCLERRTALNKSLSNNYDDIIERDLHRTFHSHSAYAHRLDAIRNGRQRLQRVLQAYAAYNETLGYVQGMNYVAAMCLVTCNGDEASALLLVVAIFHHFDLAPLYSPDSPLLSYAMHHFEHELEMRLPRVFEHFRANDISPYMFLTEWLTTVFAYNLSFECCARVWDFFLSADDGMLALFRVGLAALELRCASLLHMSMETFLMEFKGQMILLDAEEVLRVAAGVSLSRQTVEGFKKVVGEARADARALVNRQQLAAVSSNLRERSVTMPARVSSDNVQGGSREAHGGGGGTRRFNSATDEIHWLRSELQNRDEKIRVQQIQINCLKELIGEKSRSAASDAEEVSPSLNHSISIL